MNKLESKSIVLPVDLLLLSSVKSNNGGVHTDITLEGKLIYIYLRTLRDELHPSSMDLCVSQEDISKMLGMSRKTVQRKLALLIVAGLIKIRTTDRYNYYTVFDYDNVQGENVVKFKPERKIDYDKDPCHVYVQELTSPFFSCIKFGISSDVNLRMKQQDKDSMFKHKVLMSWDVGNRTNAVQIENYLKGKYETGVAMKEWLPSGYTETIDMEHKDCVIQTIQQMIDNYQELDL